MKKTHHLLTLICAFVMGFPSRIAGGCPLRKMRAPLTQFNTMVSRSTLSTAPSLSPTTGVVFSSRIARAWPATV